MCQLPQAFAGKRGVYIVHFTNDVLTLWDYPAEIVKDCQQYFTFM